MKSASLCALEAMTNFCVQIAMRTGNYNNNNIIILFIFYNNQYDIEFAKQ